MSKESTMKLSVITAATKAEWESTVSKFREANFLQSWNWGAFHESLGKTVLRLLFLDDRTSVGFALLVVEKAKRGNYITIAGGPVFDWKNEELFSYVFEQIIAYAKEQHVDFIRFRPQELQTQDSVEKVAKIGAVSSPMHVTADLTLQLVLSLSENELLGQMRKNHRSSIKKSQSLGITVVQSTDAEDIKDFYDHQLALAQRHGFVPFSYKFLFEQFRAFVSDGQVALFHAYQGAELLASAFIIFYNGEAVYHYGISTEANAKLPGSYACQWAAILEAKKRGCELYNFWGIAPEATINHRFAGVTLFKTGFGGKQVEYLHAHDIPLSGKYKVTAAFEFLRKKLRRL